MVTPGVAFLARIALHILSKPVLLGFVVHYASRRLGTEVPVWATVLLAGASLPLYATYRVWRNQRRDRAEAAAMGARLAPVVAGKLPGNFDIVRMIIHHRMHGYPGDGFNELVAEYGPVVNLRLLWADIYFTVSPDHMKAMLATDFNNWEKGDRFKRIMKPILGTGVFNSDGDMWKFHRSITRPFFSKDKISHFDLAEQYTDVVVSIMKQRARGGYAFDFQDLIGRFTMDSTTDSLFGTCVNSLKGNIPYAHNAVSAPAQPPSAHNTFIDAFIAAFNQALITGYNRDARGEIWPLFEIFKDDTDAPMKTVNTFLDPIIEAAIERKRVSSATEQKDGEMEAETLLDELLNSTSDPKLLKDEALNILLAGKDTTMHTMTIVIYFLSIYPNVCQRLREEVLAHVGPTKRPTYDDIKEMKFLRAVLNETLRLYPAVPLNQRDAIQSTTWPSPNPNEKPIYIPAGAKGVYSPFLMQRRQDLWGPDAEEFSPDRFLDERLKKYLLTNAFQFLPFNAGPRICLGQQFAYNQMSFVLIRLLQSFSSFELDDAAFPPGTRPPAEWKTAPGRKGFERFRPMLHLTMSTLGGMWIKATEVTE